eukprot:11198228-Lingulodinium_polyedra.AAC.1
MRKGRRPVFSEGVPGKRGGQPEGVSVYFSVYISCVCLPNMSTVGRKTKYIYRRCTIAANGGKL